MTGIVNNELKKRGSGRGLLRSAAEKGCGKPLEGKVACYGEVFFKTAIKLR